MTAQSQETQPTDAVIGVLRLFDRFPIVALGEAHGLEQEAAFIADLVQHPTFPQRVQAIVVEFGNALYQEVVDRFIAGDTVSPADLRPVWRDEAGAGPWGCIAPIYERLFYTVRAANQALAPERRIRVLLGDPPFDWHALRTSDEFRAVMGTRDSHFVHVVEQEVLRRGQRALLIAGLLHFLRGGPVPVAETVTHLLDRHHPSATYVILPHVNGKDTGIPEPFADLEARLASWPTPGFAPLRGTWLGDTPANTLFGRAGFLGEDGIESFPWAGITLPLGDLADGYLYLGSSHGYTYSEPDPALFEDEEYMAEVRRRHELVFGTPFDRAG